VAINKYQVKFKQCDDQKWIAIRQFENQRRVYNLLVNSATLETQIVADSCLRCSDIQLSNLQESKYKNLLDFSKNHSAPMSDAGLTNVSQEKGFFLSVDLCPSKKSFDYQIFTNPKISSHKNFPVAIAVSGGWLGHNKETLNWLKAKQLSHDLDIVWVNHSYTHPYKKGISNENNFMLTPGDSLEYEVFNQEKYMISNGLTPSIFFRFPGLISNSTLVSELENYGLVTLGSDAWLALGQQPKSGSIILIHGNGNEEVGVNLFLRLLQKIQDLNVFKALSPRA
jgi:hypothetical protein